MTGKVVGKVVGKVDASSSASSESPAMATKLKEPVMTVMTVGELIPLLGQI